MNVHVEAMSDVEVVEEAVKGVKGIPDDADRIGIVAKEVTEIQFNVEEMLKRVVGFHRNGGASVHIVIST